MGDLHSVYLVMTGTILPENGIALPDVTQRADLGKFNQIDLDNNKFLHEQNRIFFRTDKKVMGEPD